VATATFAIHVKTRKQHVRGGTQNIIKNVRSNTHREAYNFARNVEAGSKRRVHVITGRLKHSIHRVRLGPGHHRVIVGAYYGVYEEYGTRHRPPHPFFRPAVRAAKAEFDRKMKRVFNG
jgi:HK97 gp10 family phage protein